MVDQKDDLTLISADMVQNTPSLANLPTELSLFLTPLRMSTSWVIITVSRTQTCHVSFIVTRLARIWFALLLLVRKERPRSSS
jgi:hypothetical protein